MGKTSKRHEHIVNYFYNKPSHSIWKGFKYKLMDKKTTQWWLQAVWHFSVLSPFDRPDQQVSSTEYPTLWGPNIGLNARWGTSHKYYQSINLSRSVPCHKSEASSTTNLDTYNFAYLSSHPQLKDETVMSVDFRELHQTPSFFRNWSANCKNLHHKLCLWPTSFTLF